MHKSLEKFTPYVEAGHLRQVVSPCGKLVLWNYTDHCTYEKAWDEVTLNARGTVYEIETGKVVARAFPKFFNFGELPTEKQKQILNSRDFTAYEKMDGSLGIIYYYDGEWRVNTRGSFTSDQAIRGKEMLDKKYDTERLDPTMTFMVEIIYPENRIIVDYGNEEKLVMLACLETSEDSEVEDHEFWFSHLCFRSRITPCLKEKFNSIEELQTHLETLDHTEEGYVVRLGNGYRVKFKSVEYLKLAKIMSHVSPLAFWEHMENGKIELDYLEHLPEEFRAECDVLTAKLEEQYQRGYAEVVGAFEIAMKAVGEEPGPVTPELRKKIGLYVKESKPKHSGAIFPYLLANDKGVEKYVKNYIKPVGNVLREL